eukprot:365093-Chlamydomonas_euryale.AAC.11
MGMGCNAFQPHPVNRDVRTGRRADNALFRHACESRCIQNVHQLGHPCRSAHLSRRLQGAIRPSAHAGDPWQVGVVGADGRLRLLVCEAAGLRYSVEKGWENIDTV